MESIIKTFFSFYNTVAKSSVGQAIAPFANKATVAALFAAAHRNLPLTIGVGLAALGTTASVARKIQIRSYANYVIQAENTKKQLNALKALFSAEIEKFPQQEEEPSQELDGSSIPSDISSAVNGIAAMPPSIAPKEPLEENSSTTDQSLSSSALALTVINNQSRTQLDWTRSRSDEQGSVAQPISTKEELQARLIRSDIKGISDILKKSHKWRQSYQHVSSLLEKMSRLVKDGTSVTAEIHQILEESVSAQKTSIEIPKLRTQTENLLNNFLSLIDRCYPGNQSLQGESEPPCAIKKTLNKLKAALVKIDKDSPTTIFHTICCLNEVETLLNDQNLKNIAEEFSHVRKGKSTPLENLKAAYQEIRNHLPSLRMLTNQMLDSSLALVKRCSSEGSSTEQKAAQSKLRIIKHNLEGLKQELAAIDKKNSVEVVLEIDYVLERIDSCFTKKCNIANLFEGGGNSNPNKPTIFEDYQTVRAAMQEILAHLKKINGKALLENPKQCFINLNIEIDTAIGKIDGEIAKAKQLANKSHKQVWGIAYAGFIALGLILAGRYVLARRGITWLR